MNYIWELFRRCWLVNFLAITLALLIIGGIPAIQLGFFYRYWIEKGAVDRGKCSCSCWDTIFKGTYERLGNTYHHVYFNATFNTLQIWIFTILSILLTYEAIKGVVRLFLLGKLRFLMVVALLAGVYPHYYAWWGFFNYLNDDFYSQWWHQTLFTVTEVASTCILFWFCDSNVPVKPGWILVVVDIALSHILLGGVDQFVAHMLLGQGTKSQKIRDVFLLSSDIFIFFLGLVLLWKFKGQSSLLLIDDKSAQKVPFFRVLLLHVGIIFSIWSVGTFIVPSL